MPAAIASRSADGHASSASMLGLGLGQRPRHAFDLGVEVAPPVGQRARRSSRGTASSICSMTLSSTRRLVPLEGRLVVLEGLQLAGRGDRAAVERAVHGGHLLLDRGDLVLEALLGAGDLVRARSASTPGRSPACRAHGGARVDLARSGSVSRRWRSWSARCRAPAGRAADRTRHVGLFLAAEEMARATLHPTDPSRAGSALVSFAASSR